MNVTVKNLEERESASSEREEILREKYIFLEGQSKEALYRIEVAERLCGVCERNITETTNEIALWTKKIEEIEEELWNMDNIADSPEADVTMLRRNLELNDEPSSKELKSRVEEDNNVVEDEQIENDNDFGARDAVVDEVDAEEEEEEEQENNEVSEDEEDDSE